MAGIFLFNSNISSPRALLLEYLIKVLAVAVTGVISGFATVWGNDMYQWVKAKFLNKKAKAKRNEEKTKIKRAS